MSKWSDHFFTSSNFTKKIEIPVEKLRKNIDYYTHNKGKTIADLDITAFLAVIKNLLDLGINKEKQSLKEFAYAKIKLQVVTTIK